MRRASLVAAGLLVALWLSGALAVEPVAAATEGSGWLHVKRFIPDKRLHHFKGFEPPKVFVFDDAGKWLSSDNPGGHYFAGDYIELPEGWYGVEIGDVREPLNRWRYYVKAGQVTVVKSGLVSLATPPAAEQTPDSCKPWRAIMHAYVRAPDGALKLVMTNLKDEVDEFGMLQLHPGKYVIGFNGLQRDIEVRADQAVAFPTVYIDPLPQKKYRIAMAKDDASDTPSLYICSQRPTQIPQGKYWGSYYVDTMEPPFRRRVWEELDFSGDPSPYRRAPSSHVSKKVFRGEGSDPAPATPR